MTWTMNEAGAMPGTDLSIDRVTCPPVSPSIFPAARVSDSPDNQLPSTASTTSPSRTCSVKAAGPPRTTSDTTTMSAPPNPASPFSTTSPNDSTNTSPRFTRARGVAVSGVVAPPRAGLPTRLRGTTSNSAPPPALLADEASRVGDSSAEEEACAEGEAAYDGGDARRAAPGNISPSMRACGTVAALLRWGLVVGVGLAGGGLSSRAFETE
mmetsp:Transcript_60614/g.124760  ORF Transcript_60614/g.124760 Transcript_60614/m.124760 type:complete len:211 (+) Transcript_60614:385-1017(+)